MASPVFQSVQTTTWHTSSSTVVTKPANLAVGDLMIAVHIASNHNALPSGFTSLGTQSDSVTTYGSKIAYKIADSSDVAASNFTFTTTGSELQMGAIARITGASATASYYKYNGASTTNTATPSVAAGVTPHNNGESNLLMMFWYCTTTTTAIAGYAIATSDPSWTEGYDLANSTTENAGMAYATRSQVTATGNISATGGGVNSDWAGQLISIPAPFNFSIADSVTVTDAKVISLSILVQEALTLTDTLVSTVQLAWSNVAKNVSSWFNVDKN